MAHRPSHFKRSKEKRRPGQSGWRLEADKTIRHLQVAVLRLRIAWPPALNQEEMPLALSEKGFQELLSREKAPRNWHWPQSSSDLGHSSEIISQHSQSCQVKEDSEAFAALKKTSCGYISMYLRYSRSHKELKAAQEKQKAKIGLGPGISNLGSIMIYLKL